MVDLTNEEIKALGRAVDIDMSGTLLKEVTYMVNVIRDLVDQLSPPDLHLVEPLPILPSEMTVTDRSEQS